MSFYNKLIASGYNIAGKLSKFDTWEKFRFLIKNQFNSYEELENIQWIKFKKLMKHAYENIPFYREKWDKSGVKPEDIKNKSDVPFLPIITKTELEENFPEKCLAKGTIKKDWSLVYSSGTTGKPFSVYIDLPCYTSQYADLLYGYYLDGWELGDKMATVRNKAHGDYKGKFTRGNVTPEPHSLIRDIVYFFCHRKILLSPLESGTYVEEPSLKNAANILLQYNPKLLEGNPVYWEILADYLIKEDITINGIKAIDVDETPVTKITRDKFKMAFNAGVFDCYGSHELGVVSHECDAHEGNHILTLSNFVEFIENQKEAQCGELANLVVTSLNNYAMPLIRYDTGDLGRRIKNKCSCKRGFPLMSHVEGRVVDSIKVDGKFYTPFFFLKYFQNIKEISFFQISESQHNDSYLLNIVSHKEIPKSVEEKLKNELEANLKRKIYIKYVKEIEVENSGKIRWIKIHSQI